MSKSEASLNIKRVLFLAKHAMLKVYLAEGEVQGLRSRIIFADDGSTMPYISHLVFPNGAEISEKGTISAFKAPSLIESDADIVVVGANHLFLNRYEQKGFHIVPKWVCPLLQIPDGLDAAIENLSYNARKDIRRNIRKALDKGFTYTTTNDPGWFEDWYSNVYLRYGLSKHGDLAQVDGYNRVKDAFDRGIGMVISVEDTPVIGSVVLREDDVFRGRYMGVFPGKEELAAHGASTAMYYYCMQLASEWGCTSVNMGSTRPFLSDGVMKFKMKWEPEILHDTLSTATFAIAAPQMTPAAQAFLAANPFFEMVGDELKLFKM